LSHTCFQFFQECYEFATWGWGWGNIAERTVILDTDYLFVNGSEGSLYNKLIEKRVVQYRQQGGANGWERLAVDEVIVLFEGRDIF